MTKVRTKQSQQEENMLLGILSNEIMSTNKLVKLSKLKYTTVVRHTQNLVGDGVIYIRKHNNKNYFCKIKKKLDDMPSRLDRIYNLLESEGDLRIDDVVKKLISYSKMSIRNVVKNQKEGYVRVYEYAVEDEHYHMLTIKKPTEDMLKVTRRQASKTRNRKLVEPDKPSLNYEMIKKHQPQMMRGHQKFDKYKDKGFKYGSDALHVISEVLALFQTSENPYLFNFKLRHRIETMPEKYWLEQVSLKSYVKDIDMVELPKTGAIKDVDRRPGSLI